MSSRHSEFFDKYVTGGDGAGDHADRAGDADGLPSTRPALRAVQIDQAKIVRRPLDGFDSEIGILTWLQRAAVVTLGELDDRLYSDLVVADETMHQALLSEDARALRYHEPLTSSTADQLREDLVSTILNPACIRAYHSLEATAAEYVERDVYAENYNPSDLDPSKQRHTAMRPGYDEIHRDQRASLRAFWSGFDDRRDLLGWVQELKDPTNSQLPESFATDILHDDVAVRHLLGDVEDELRAQTYQDWFLASGILPHFAAGVRTLSPTEVIDAEKDGIKPYGQ